MSIAHPSPWPETVTCSQLHTTQSNLASSHHISTLFQQVSPDSASALQSYNLINPNSLKIATVQSQTFSFTAEGYGKPEERGFLGLSSAGGCRSHHTTKPFPVL